MLRHIAAVCGVSAVVAASSSRPAEYLHLDSLGVIAPGKSADFLVLDANPLDDIRNTRRIASVYVQGNEVDRAALRKAWALGSRGNL